MIKLLNNFIDKSSDMELPHTIYLCVYFSDIWTQLNDMTKTKVQRYLESASDKEVIIILNCCLKLDLLKEISENRMRAMQLDDLYSAVANYQLGVEAISIFIERYCKSSNYYQANDIAVNLIIPFLDSMDEQLFTKILVASKSEADIYGSYRWNDILMEVFNKKIISRKKYIKLLKEYKGYDYFKRLYKDNDRD